MTIAKATALTAGFIGAFGLGIAVGPSMRHHDTVATTAPAIQVPAPVADQAAAKPAVSPPVARAPRFTAPPLEPAGHRPYALADAGQAADGTQDL